MLSVQCGIESSAGGFGCGNDLVEALITSQIIPARIEAQIAAGWASRDLRDNFELLERGVQRHQFQLAIAINAYKPPHVPDQTLPVSNDGLAIVARHAVAKRYKEENYYLQSTDKLSKNTVASPLAFIVICAISCTK